MDIAKLMSMPPINPFEAIKQVADGLKGAMDHIGKGIGELMKGNIGGAIGELCKGLQDLQKASGADAMLKGMGLQSPQVNQMLQQLGQGLEGLGQAAGNALGGAVGGALGKNPLAEAIGNTLGNALGGVLGGGQGGPGGPGGAGGQGQPGGLGEALLKQLLPGNTSDALTNAMDAAGARHGDLGSAGNLGCTGAAAAAGVEQGKDAARAVAGGGFGVGEGLSKLSHQTTPEDLGMKNLGGDLYANQQGEILTGDKVREMTKAADEGKKAGFAAGLLQGA